LTPANATVRAGKTIDYTFSWTVPKPRKWRSLRDLDLRLTDRKGTAISVGWSQANDTLSLVNARHRATGGALRPGRPGSLRGAAATLGLRGTKVVTGGRTARLILPLTVTSRAAGRSLRVEVAAADDSGRQTPWNVAGVLTVSH
jgi:hypothetical protein